jgi:FAD/FMN-containing dehydrogenase
VGTGGHTSFGGFGPYSRQAGLLLDRVFAADVVLANGTVVTAAQYKHSDLFWVRVVMMLFTALAFRI